MKTRSSSLHPSLLLRNKCHSPRACHLHLIDCRWSFPIHLAIPENSHCQPSRAETSRNPCKTQPLHLRNPTHPIHPPIHHPHRPIHPMAHPLRCPLFRILAKLQRVSNLFMVINITDYEASKEWLVWQVLTCVTAIKPDDEREMFFECLSDYAFQLVIWPIITLARLAPMRIEHKCKK